MSGLSAGKDTKAGAHSPGREACAQGKEQGESSFVGWDQHGLGKPRLLGLDLTFPFVPQGWPLVWILRATGTLTSAGFPFMISWSGALQAPLLSSLW